MQFKFDPTIDAAAQQLRNGTIVVNSSRPELAMTAITHLLSSRPIPSSEEKQTSPHHRLIPVRYQIR